MTFLCGRCDGEESETEVGGRSGEASEVGDAIDSEEAARVGEKE